MISSTPKEWCESSQRRGIVERIEKVKVSENSAIRELSTLRKSRVVSSRPPTVRKTGERNRNRLCGAWTPAVTGMFKLWRFFLGYRQITLLLATNGWLHCSTPNSSTLDSVLRWLQVMYRRTISRISCGLMPKNGLLCILLDQQVARALSSPWQKVSARSTSDRRRQPRRPNRGQEMKWKIFIENRLCFLAESGRK